MTGMRTRFWSGQNREKSNGMELNTLWTSWSKAGGLVRMPRENLRHAKPNQHFTILVFDNRGKANYPTHARQKSRMTMPYPFWRCIHVSVIKEVYEESEYYVDFTEG